MSDLVWFFRALTRTIGRAGTLDRPRKRRKSGTVSDLTRACIIEHCGAAVSVSLRKVREMHLCAKSKSKSFCSAVHVRVPRPSLRWRSSQEPNRITFGMQITSLSLSLQSPVTFSSLPSSEHTFWAFLRSRLLRALHLSRNFLSNSELKQQQLIVFE